MWQWFWNQTVGRSWKELEDTGSESWRELQGTVADIQKVGQ